MLVTLFSLCLKYYTLVEKIPFLPPVLLQVWVRVSAVLHRGLFISLSFPPGCNQCDRHLSGP